MANVTIGGANAMEFPAFMLKTAFPFSVDKLTPDPAGTFVNDGVARYQWADFVRSPIVLIPAVILPIMALALIFGVARS